MNVFLLKDLDSAYVDAVIIADISTLKDVENAIKKMKKDFYERNEYWEWDDLIDCLPKDCVVYDRWSKLQTTYY